MNIHTESYHEVACVFWTALRINSNLKAGIREVHQNKHGEYRCRTTFSNLTNVLAWVLDSVIADVMLIVEHNSTVTRFDSIDL
jgi:hypothetical protein